MRSVGPCQMFGLSLSRTVDISYKIEVTSALQADACQGPLYEWHDESVTEKDVRAPTVGRACIPSC
jgi:hypothetical protein